MSKPLKSSPQRDTFQVESALRRAKEGETSADEANDLVELYKSINQRRRDQEQDPEWQKDNLEYDLRSTDWIAEKCREEYYAQNLYAALCNNEFIKNDVWPLLQKKTWRCSWRYAGGIIADIRQQGDYIDWYCSGIRSDWTDEEYNNATKEQQEQYLYVKNKFVSESVVTEEIRQDLFKLGWIVADPSIEEN